jgi:hypothetical protein
MDSLSFSFLTGADLSVETNETDVSQYRLPVIVDTYGTIYVCM